MNSKEEILEKSRRENKDKDLFEKEIQINAGNIGASTAVVLATVFFAIQIFVGKGMNYGLYAIVFSILATSNVIKSIHMKRRYDIGMAIAHTIITLVFSGAHIYELITTSPIL